jgi:hypothetical protein
MIPPKNPEMQGTKLYRKEKFLSYFAMTGKLKQRHGLGFFSGIMYVIFLLFATDVYAQDIITQYQLPPLERAPKGSKAEEILKKAKVLRYAEEMPVRFAEFMDTGRYIQELKA